MDETTLKISIASFFHDMGKFAGSQVFKMSQDEFASRAADFLPVRKGRYSHSHALYTSEFISRYIDWLPDEFNRPWGEGDGLVKLAASHHNPSSPMEWIVAEADRISSGMDRRDYEAAANDAVSVPDFEKTRLVPLLECIDYERDADYSTSDRFSYAYELAPLAPGTIFPRKKSDIIPEDRNKAKRQYLDLFEGFSKELKDLPHRNHIELWFSHFESLVMEYTSNIPAARVGNVIPDVSLYDHLKTTSAIATALYCFHEQTNTLETGEVRKEDQEKFLLISADFHGIQHFIFSGYGDARKYRSKLLRGRSFYVSALMETAAYLLCREMGLPFTSVILNAGGRFTILAPNTDKARAAVRDVERRIEKWFADLTFGESGVSFSTVAATPADFKSGSYPVLHDRMNAEMARKKFARIDMEIYGGVVENYFEDDGADVCPFCGKRPAGNNIAMRDGTHACPLCRDHVFLGENLVKKNTLAILDAEKFTPGVQGLAAPVFGCFQLVFPDSDMDRAADDKSLLMYWKLGFGADDDGQSKAALKFFNGYVPVYTKEDLNDQRILSAKDDEADPEEQFREAMPKTLNHIAALAKNVKPENSLEGVEALGVLKADVDHLGLLMACGLGENLYSISRVATLSRQINNYFTVYLPYFLSSHESYKNIYTVFAGGDDLFLIGPWNRIMEFAPELAESFADYVCRNPKVTLSAGISFHKAHTPVNAMAEAAEFALEKAKDSGRSRLTVFDEVLGWQEAGDLYAVEEILGKWLDQKFISSTMLYRLNTFINMADLEKKLTTGDGRIHIRDMNCTRWRALLAYAIERNVLKTLDPDQRKDRIMEVREHMAQWLANWGGKLRVPLWYVQYNRR